MLCLPQRLVLGSEVSVASHDDFTQPAFEQVIQEILTLHRSTIHQLSDLVKVQRETTHQLHDVSGAMRDITSLLREVTTTHRRVNEALTTLSQQLSQSTTLAEPTRATLTELLGTLQRTTPRLDELAGQFAGFSVLLRQILREQERVALLTLSQRIHRHAPTLFAPYLSQLRWGVPGIFYDEVLDHLPVAAREGWLACELIITGQLRHQDSPQSVWITLQLVSDISESTTARVLRLATMLRQTLGVTLPSLASLRTDNVQLALTQGIVLVQDSLVVGWEQALEKWLVGPTQ